MTNDNNRIEVYTDGCCLKNPGGAGGYGVIVERPDGTVQELSQGYFASTNNRMEIMAAIAGIEALKSGVPERVTVYSDSQYLVHAMMSGWLLKWLRNGWRTSTGPVKNRDLWERLAALRSAHTEIRFVWVRGHDGHSQNERCDVLADRAARGAHKSHDKGYQP